MAFGKSAEMPCGWVRRAWTLGLTAAISLFTGMSVLWATARHGIGVWPDSVIYLSAAENLRAGRGLVDYSGNPLGAFPPGFSVLIAFVSALLGSNAHEAARWISAASYAGMVFLVGIAAWQLTRSAAYTVGSCVLAATASPLRQLTLIAWSEPPFTVLTMLCLLALARMLSLGTSAPARTRWLWFGVAAAASAAACLTRHIGFATVVAGVAAIGRGTSLRRERMGLALLFCVISLLPTLLWMARNRSLTGHLAGPRYATTVTFRDNVRRTASTVGAWFLPEALKPTPAPSAIVITAFVGAFAWLRFYLKRRAAAIPDPCDPERYLVSVLGWYAAAFIPCMLAAASLLAFDAIGDRLLSPLYPVALLLIVAAARSLADVWSPAASALVVSACAVLVAWDGITFTGSALQAHRIEGSGYSSPAAMVPGLPEAIESEQRKADVALFCNSPSRLWWTYRLVAHNAPRRLASANTAEIVPLRERYAAFAAEHQRGLRLLLVWYVPPKPWYATLEAVRREYGDLVPLWAGRGCTLYEVRPRGSAMGGGAAP